MISIKDCRTFSGLETNEMILGGSSSARQRLLLSSYLMSLWRGPEVVRDLMVADIKSCVDLGAMTQAADLFWALRKFLSDYPEARLERSPSDRERAELGR